MRRPTCTIAVLCAALALGAPASAQPIARGVVAGVVVDSAGRGVVADVTALDQRGVTRATTRSDSTGHFGLRADADSVRLVARRLGYAPAESGLLATAVSAEVTLRLMPLPQTLGTVVIEGNVLRREFASRMAAARGRQRGLFLDSADIATSDATSVEKLLDRVRFNPFGGQCVVRDGFYLGNAAREAPGRPSLYNHTSLRDLRGVEVYESPLSMPTELARRISWPRGVAPCGRVVVLWTGAAFTGR